MPPASHLEHLERSRTAILEAIGEHPDLAFVRGVGNWGDELIWAGTRRLLDGLVYREIGVDELPSAIGHTVVICGGGAFCHPFHEFMPQVLAVAELRFERVIVLPSSFDTAADPVRSALSRSSAIVFAREHESFRRIQPLCDARLAHDTAFFFDYRPYRTNGAGSGILSAFRTDEESTGARVLPDGNDDISLTAGSLDAWLSRIAAHELVRTDRAHVMIAAAMLDKTVEFAPSSYFKVPAIAEYALGDFPLRRLDAETTTSGEAERARTLLARTPCSPEAEAIRERLGALGEAATTTSAPSPAGTAGGPRVTVVILSHERPTLVLGAIHSAIEASERERVALKVLVVENNSSERTRRILAAACTAHPSVELHQSDRNLGCAGGRSFALELASTELVMFLDDDAELMPGALSALLHELDRNPEAQGVSATVVLPDERVSHSGGWYSESRETVCFTLGHSGLALEQSELSPSGPCDWIPGTAALVRRDLFEQFPLDLGMESYYEDTEWCLRVSRALPGSFRRSREALVLHHAQPKPWGQTDFKGRAAVVGMISTAAHFHRRHGRLLRVPGVDIFALIPGLTRADGGLELARARILMELAGTHSSDWLLMAWMNGSLDPLLQPPDPAPASDALAGTTHELSAQLDGLRGEVESAARQLDHAGGLIESLERERQEAWDRLQRIYGSRLWRLGASYDRARRGARRLRALGRAQ
jgi:GT2 family glycosyltransferase/exopolysaccharide biosynthesis predicted pyruvyltransferase EpsI